MRFIGLLLAGVWFISSMSQTQTVQVSELIGKWQGPIVIQDSSPGLASDNGQFRGGQYWWKAPVVKAGAKAVGVMFLRPDSLWWEWRSPDGKGTGWGDVIGGIWQLVRDTLMLAMTTDHSFWGAGQREKKSISDTTGLGGLPKIDSSFWSKAAPAVTGYKVNVSGQQLTLVRYDSLAKNPSATPKGVYKQIVQSIGCFHGREATGERWYACPVGVSAAVPPITSRTNPLFVPLA